MILHIDMDAFFASIEQLDHPELKGTCVIVGGISGRGVVSAASYEARKFGVRSAMPIYQAQKLCPHAKILPPRKLRYKEISDVIMRELKYFSPLIEIVSIDEAYMDVSGCRKLFGDPVDMAWEIKKRIRETVRLTCSIGVAPTKVLAKIASDMNKPDGLFVISPADVESFSAKLPISKIPGAGKRTQAMLRQMGITVLSDVQRFPEKTLIGQLGKFGYRLIELSNGLDTSRVNPCTARKSVSTETTLPEDTNEREVLAHYLLAQSQEVGRQLRKFNMRAKTIFLKIKYADFTLKTKSKTLRSATQASEVIYKEALVLLDTFNNYPPLRLIGVGASGFEKEAMPVQLELFGETKSYVPDWESVDKAVDDIECKFGRRVVHRASLFPKKSKASSVLKS